MFQWAEQSLNAPFFFSIVSIFLVILLFKLSNRSTTATKLNLPPSPSKLPIIGNLHQLSSLPHRSLRSLAKKHGPVMLLHLGQSPTVVVSSADAAREMFKTQDLNFSGRPRMRFQDKLDYSSMHLGFLPYGEYWRQVRKICVLQLLTAQRVESFKSVRAEETHLMIEKIRQSCSSTSCVVDLSETIASLTRDIVCRAVLGRKFDKDAVINMKFDFVSGFDIGDFIPWLSWVNIITGFDAQMMKIFKALDEFLESVINDHIESKKNSSDGVEDFVDVLLGLGKDSTGVTFGKPNIKAIIMDMFLAGSDTVSTTIVWALTELIRHPEIMKEVQKEIREIGKENLSITEDDLGKMHYLKLVMKETLRLHVPGPLLIPHESIQDTKLLGYDIPAKTRVLVNAWAIATDPLLWEEPNEFRPKRFLNSSLDYKGNDFEYIPFGAGRRGCPGISFAIPTMELSLANLLFHFDWTLPNGEPRPEDLDITEGFGIVTYKKDPLVVAATPYI
ncbi:hypothetical protein AQUCO_01800231v1 [Aquilegia coerulea]|uniref:Cytochrome P450 n=1 Tax=Aquilegia coerulea TaxID=218851 RepID=A0A2G5DKH6_AQUCA|nr:hypothetical protein AQUCO_01800231v1 [Aquilegia coerulea]